VQVAIDDACRDLPDLADMGAKRLKTCLLRQLLRNSDNRNEDNGCNQGRNADDKRDRYAVWEAWAERGCGFDAHN
jgi:hypothetical protein